jgi:hypothetical protein
VKYYSVLIPRLLYSDLSHRTMNADVPKLNISDFLTFLFVR